MEESFLKNSYILHAKSLSLVINDQVIVSNANFSVSAGEIVLILGANGSGKTTLLRTCAGLSMADNGELQRCDAYIYIGHLPAIKPMLTVIENATWMQAFGENSGYAVETALETLGLTQVKDVLCACLSAGQQRRVGMLRLLLLKAGLWILDEPLTSLDHAGILLLQHLLDDHLARGGAVAMSTHQMMTMQPHWTIKVFNLSEDDE